MAEEAEPKETMIGKVCFVTTGATAPFVELITSVLAPATLTALQNLGYARLIVQYGTAKDVYESALSNARAAMENQIQTSHFSVEGKDFFPDALVQQFRDVQSTKGLVISHAGSGTILAALRFQVPLIVVPNTSLLDNHQEQLAVAMEKSNYVLRGNVEDLIPAIQKSEEFRVKMSQFPPITSGKHRETKSFAAIMDETMGFMD